MTTAQVYVIIQSQAEGSPTGGGERGVCSKGYKLVTKNFFDFFAKGVDNRPVMCYNEVTSGGRRTNPMTNEYWEAHESEWLAEQEYLLWLAENGDE